MNIEAEASAILTEKEDRDIAGEPELEQIVKAAGGALTHCEALSEQQLSVSRVGFSV